MNKLFTYSLAICALAISVVCSSCSKTDDEDLLCTNTFYYVSSAVCIDYTEAAAVRDVSGEVFIARNLFLHVNRVDVSVDMEFVADFESIDEPVDRSQCGILLAGPIIELSCFSIVD